MSSLHIPLLGSLPELTVTAVIDILAVSFLIYQFFLIIRGRRAVPILTGIFMLVAVYGLSVFAGLGLLRTILETLAPYTVFALIVMFQADIRRLLARMGRQRWLAGAEGLGRRELSEQIVLTLEILSERRIGALIVLERDIGLRTFIESGIGIDGHLSRDLLVSIFLPTGPMHDGAVIIQGDRIAAATCFLPLSMNPRLVSTLGTRHRAAIGITEEADCLSLIVSEETGKISVAAFGNIQLDVTLDEVRQAIARHFGAKPARLPRPYPGVGLPGVARTETEPEPTEWKEAGRP